MNSADSQTLRPPLATRDPAARGPARLLRVLAAPWLALLGPARAARALRDARAPVIVGALALHAALIAAGVVICSLWSFTPPGGSLRETWALWHAGGPIGRGETLFGAVWGASLLVALTYAAALLPYVHRAGRLGDAYRRALAAALSAGGVVAVGALGILAVLIADILPPLWQPTPGTHGLPLAGLLAAAVALVASVAVRQPGGREPFDALRNRTAPTGASTNPAIGVASAADAFAAAGAAAGEPADGPPDAAPLCDACGYDLTHHATDGRCPECALPIIESLEPGRRRPGVRWERDPDRSLSAWAATLVAALARPGRFYGTMRARRPLRAGVVFAAWTVLSIYAGAAVVLGVLYWEMSLAENFRYWDWTELALVVSGGPLWTVLLCAGAHHLVTGLTFATWRLRGGPGDFHLLARVACYETVMFWPLSAVLGALFSSYVLFDSWISSMGVPFIVGVPAEAATVFAAVAAVLAVWLWRYEVAVRAVRWSNY